MRCEESGEGEFFDCVDSVGGEEWAEASSSVGADTPHPQPDNIVDDTPRQQIEDRLTDDEREEKRCQALSLKASGNEAFGGGRFEEAVELYTRALAECPLCFVADRGVFHNNRAAALIKLEQYDAAADDCDAALQADGDNDKALLRRAVCREHNDDTLEKALDDYKLLLSRDADNARARAAVHALPARIADRNERMKTEMMAKLKDLGNTVLRPFGLSTDSFCLEQTAEGGYSVKMKQ